MAGESGKSAWDTTGVGSKCTCAHEHIKLRIRPTIILRIDFYKYFENSIRQMSRNVGKSGPSKLESNYFVAAKKPIPRSFSLNGMAPNGRIAQ